MTLPPIQAFFFRDFPNAYMPDILDELYKKKVYEAFLPKDKKKTLCLEIGGNIGLATYYFAPHFERVIVLEPSGEHFEVLEKMLQHNGITNVLPLKLALSNQNGEADFYHHTNTTMYSLRPEVNVKNESEKVQTMDLETLCKTYDIDTIDLMKLDVEGSEYDIISSEAFEKTAPKIKAIVCELHQWSGVNYQQIVNTLKDYGFEVNQIPSEATIISAVR